MAKAVDVPIQVGGGIRDEKRVKQLLDLGINRVIVGTMAIENKELLKELKLDIPFSLKIARKLQKKGYQIKDTLDVEELEKQLCQLHAKI